MKQQNSEEWLYEITAQKKLLNFNFKEIWRYRDLLLLFVKRDLVTLYKQTILGPLWYLIQPLFTSVVFTLIFNNLGNIQTGGIPPFLFNLAGITAWNYFKVCLTQTSTTFTSNQNIFGKVYFPRVIVPLSVTISNLMKFGIQFFIFFCFYLYYVSAGVSVSPSKLWFLFPVYVIMMGLLGMGMGMIISSLTTKYRDLSIALNFAVQLLMYLSAVPYPISEANEKFPYFVARFVSYNPLAQIIEGFRHIMLSTGSFDLFKFIYTFIFCVVVFLIGLLVFNRTEKSFIDTV